MRFAQDLAAALLAPEVLKQIPRGPLTAAGREFQEKIMAAVDRSQCLEELHEKLTLLKTTAPSANANAYLSLIMSVLEKYLRKNAN